MDVLDLGGFLKDSPSEIGFDTSIFPAGEIFFRLKPRVFEKEVRILTRLNSSDDIMRLVMATDALRRVGVKELHVVIPYFCYAQQDRVCSPGESHSLKVFADLINSLKFSSVTVHDPHSYVTEAVVDNLRVVDNSFFIDQVLDYLPRKPLNIVFPDAGAEKKIKNIQSILLKRIELGITDNILVCSKERDLKTSKIIKTIVPPILNEYDTLIIDDLVLAGGTFLNIAKEIIKQGKDNNVIYLATTHGIYNDGFAKFEQYFTKLFCTDSIRTIDHPLVKQFKLF